MLNGGLFTRDFLIEGVCGTEAWAALDLPAIAQLQARLAALFARFGASKNPTEAETEKGTDLATVGGYRLGRHLRPAEPVRKGTR